MTDLLTTLKSKIESEHQAFELTVRKGLAHIREIGRYLIECQEAAKAKGVGFKKWVEAEFAGKFTYPTAWNWMSVAKHWDTFSEDELAEMTMKEMLKAVADRNRCGGPPPEEEFLAAEQTACSAARPQLGRAILPTSEDEGDGRGYAVGGLEYDRCPGQEVATGTTVTQTPCGGGPASAVGIVPSRTETVPAVVSPPTCTTEERVEEVARELGVPADKLRAALVRHGFLSPAGRL